MAKLIYAAITSLDGYVADQLGRFDWAAPDEEVHAFVNDLQRTVGTHLLGRRMYEVLLAWETMDTTGQPAVMRDYRDLWLGTDKVVYSTTLSQVSSARTKLERRFDPAAVRMMKATSDRDLSIGGPTLAAEAIKAGLVDEVHLFLNPVIVGGGTPSLPANIRWDLQLASTRRFRGGVVHLHYRA